MSDLQQVRRLAGPTAAALEVSRRRIDDLNVYPVPDGDTGTNLTLTVRAVTEALEQLGEQNRQRLAHEIARAALMGARGNSGVILSQIVRGFADVLGGAATIDSPTLARAFRSASDAAYRAVRRPVEGTMLTVIRELAEEAEAQAAPDLPVGDLLLMLVRRGEDALARTPQYLDILREAGVVDAGGAGLLELVRGLTAAVTGDELPAAPSELEEIGFDAVHQELSRYRYCTVFVVEGHGLEAAKLEVELDPLGDSLMVVGDESALKVHVHTDDPGAALSLGAAQGVLEGVEIANMHRQTKEREARLLELVPEIRFGGGKAATSAPFPLRRRPSRHLRSSTAPSSLRRWPAPSSLGREPRSGGGKAATSAPWPAPSSLRRLQACEVVAVVAGAGNARLFRSLGAAQIVEGGQSMNPSTAELLGAVEATTAPDVVVLPNNPNVILSAEQAAEHARKPVWVVRTRSIPAGIAAMVAFDGSRSAEENAAAMVEAADSVVIGAVTTASRDVALNGLDVRKGAYLGLRESEPMTGGDDFDEVAESVIESLLAERRGVLTILAGEGAPALNGLLDRIGERYPEVEVDVQDGGQAHYHLLLSAE